MTLLGLTADGRKIVQLTVTGSATVGATSFGSIACSIPLGELSRKDAVLGIASVDLNTNCYLMEAVVSSDLGTITFTVYNPGTQASITVTAIVTLLGT
jgi:hypothetical protein